MDSEYLLTIFDTLEEIKETIRKIRTEPLLVEQEELDALEYNLIIINEFANQIKRRQNGLN